MKYIRYSRQHLAYRSID